MLSDNHLTKRLNYWPLALLPMLDVGSTTSRSRQWRHRRYHGVPLQQQLVSSWLPLDVVSRWQRTVRAGRCTTDRVGLASFRCVPIPLCAFRLCRRRMFSHLHTRWNVQPVLSAKTHCGTAPLVGTILRFRLTPVAGHRGALLLLARVDVIRSL